MSWHSSSWKPPSFPPHFVGGNRKFRVSLSATADQLPRYFSNFSIHRATLAKLSGQVVS
jgi:hypothetical protein